jgi:hypothetical protein
VLRLWQFAVWLVSAASASLERMSGQTYLDFDGSRDFFVSFCYVGQCAFTSAA